MITAFLDEDALAELWDGRASSSGGTIHQCVAPLAQVGDVRDPELRRPSDRLYLLPGDLALSGFEDLLSTEWPNCLGSTNLYRAFRVITAFWQVVQAGARESGADIVLIDVGPSHREALPQPRSARPGGPQADLFPVCRRRRPRESCRRRPRRVPRHQEARREHASTDARDVCRARFDDLRDYIKLALKTADKD